MRVAMILTRSDAVGGVQVYVRDLARSLASRGVGVTVFAGGDGPLFEDLRRLGLPGRRLQHLVRPLNPGRDLLALLEILGALRRMDPQLVSVHSAKAGFLGRLAGRLLGLPTVYTVHGWPFAEGVPRAQRKVYHLAETAAARWSPRILTVCEADRDLALASLPVSPDQVVTVPNGVPDGPARSDPGAEPPRLVMAARFCPQKDHDTLLEALARLRHLPWTLDLPGEGPGLEAARRKAQGLGLADRVEFPGFLADPADRLARAQVAVLSSRWEGLPLFLLEAMRSSLPVAATAVGGVAEAVDDGSTGVLAPPGDPAALARALEPLLREPELRRRLGEAGRRRYEERFRHDRMVDRVLEVYRAAAGRRP